MRGATCGQCRGTRPKLLSLRSNLSKFSRGLSYVIAPWHDSPACDKASWKTTLRAVSIIHARSRHLHVWHASFLRKQRQLDGRRKDRVWFAADKPLVFYSIHARKPKAMTIKKFYCVGSSLSSSSSPSLSRTAQNLNCMFWKFFYHMVPFHNQPPSLNERSSKLWFMRRVISPPGLMGPFLPIELLLSTCTCIWRISCIKFRRKRKKKP